MIKRNTGILLLLFTALIVLAVYLNKNPLPARDDKDATSTATIPPVEFLLSAQEGVVASILIEDDQGQSFSAERSGSLWVVTKPYEGTADPQALDFVLGQVTAMAVLSHVNIHPANVGLNSPHHTVTIGFSGGKTFVIEIGDLTPTGTGYYIRKDGGSVLVIGSDGVESLLSLLSNPPILPTATPSPSPSTETPMPAAASETPTVTKSP